MPNKLSAEAASIAISLFPKEVLTSPAISGGNNECISRGVFSTFTFHSKVKPLTLSFVRIFSSREHREGSP